MTDYETSVQKEKEKNEKYIKEFKNWLIEKGLTTKTIRKHLGNIDLYLNDYLNYYDVTSMEDGIYEVNMFLGDWFIRKCMWSSKSSIKENASSIKKFYQCMSECGRIEENDYKSLCEDIKDGMDRYLSSLDDYDNGSYYDIF